MMITDDPSVLRFDQPDLLARLCDLDDSGLDRVPFGVIGFNAEGIVRRYGATESRMAGLSPQRVLDLPLFSVVAQCLNNFLVAQRFEDAAAQGLSLDEVVPYVLTLRMKPVRVHLRLLADPSQALRYVCILR